MRLIISILFLLTLSWGQETTAVMTLYKDGFALVKQPVEWTLTGGLNTVHIDNLPEGLIADSPYLVLDGAQIRDQRLTRDRSRGWDYITTQLGKAIEVKIQGEKSKTGILVELSSPTITLQDRDEIVVIPRNRIDFIVAKGNVEPGSSSPVLTWRMATDTAKTVNGSLLYLATGFSWQADYRMIMTEPGSSADLIVEAQIANNSRASFSNLKIHLVEGQLNRPSRLRPLSGDQLGFRAKTTSMEDARIPQESTLGDFHIYRLEDRYSLASGDLLTTTLYAPRHIEYQRTYIFQNSERVQKEEPLEVEVEFANTKENSLNIPLPAGSIKLYLNTEEGLEFLGEDQLKPVPKGGTVTLNGGRAFDVIGKRRVLNYSRQRKSEEASIELTVTNQRNEAIQVKFIEHISGNWVIRDESTMYIKEDATTIYFPATVSPESSMVITYTYRKSWN